MGPVSLGIHFFSFLDNRHFSVNTIDKMDLKPSANPLSDDPSPRNPRIHRQTGIPSISRPSTQTMGDTPQSCWTKDGATRNEKVSAFGSLKKTAYHLLSKTNDVSESILRPRFLSMPSRNQMPVLDTQTPMDIANMQDTGFVNPPTMNSRVTRSITRRRNGTIESTLKGSPIFANDKVPILGEPLPASSRKPDPRLILSSIESILGSEIIVRKYLNTHELLAMHQLDQVDFDDRDRTRVKLIKQGILDVPGRKDFLSA